MKIQAYTSRRIAAALALASISAAPTMAQFVAVNSYQPPTQPVYQQQSTAYQQSATQAYQQPVYQYGQQAAQQQQTTPVAQQPAQNAYRSTTPYQQGMAYRPAQQVTTQQALAQPVVNQQVAAAQQPAYSQTTPSNVSAYETTPTAVYPQQRVAMHHETLPAQEAESVEAAQSAAGAGAVYEGGQQQAHQYQQGAYAAAGGCVTGDCNQGGYYGAGCDTGCDLGCAPCRPRRQWFAGIYGLYLDRYDSNRQQVAYLTDTTGYTPGTDYYYQPTDTGLFTDDASLDGVGGAEIRFGSTIGCGDPCGCGPRYAWEIGYWATDDSDGSAAMSTVVSSVNANRIYNTRDYGGIDLDIDGAGATWTPVRLNSILDTGVPADGDVTANPYRIVAVRVRRNFQAQNLELNFWRFGTPECASSCGARGCSTGACGGGACNVDSCQPCRPPRRFFINGLCGVRYFRVDDDLGIDRQFTPVDGAGDAVAGWASSANGYDITSNSVVIHDIDTDNELVGFQLGASMNWLVGCKWNFFADTNFGVYGNDVEVYQRITPGGAATITGPTAVRNSETEVAFLGELRTGIGYQITCNCRLTAAYRFLGAGGLALADGQFPDSGYANSGVVGTVDANNSLILHGGQFGVEWKH